MKTEMMKMKKVLKWASIALLVLGLVVGGIGTLCGGIDTINFLFWM